MLDGGLGDDTLIGDGGADTLIGGGGVDTASYETSTAAVTANLLTPTSNLGDAAGDTYTGIANLTGGSAGDTLVGDGNANVLTGGAGADTLIGGGGVDTASYETSTAADHRQPAHTDQQSRRRGRRYVHRHRQISPAAPPGTR